MGESNLGVELISKDGVINALIPIMCEFSIDPYIQGRIIGCILNCKIAYDVEKVVAELDKEKRYGSKYDSYYEEPLYRGEMFENDVNNKTIDKAIDIVKKGGVE